jgi:tetratricopeptide (TPR) repeat protein
MILAYAGRRDAALSAEHAEALTLRIRRLCNGLTPSETIGSASDGGDLLVLEAALTLPDPPRSHVVLPTTIQEFREASVAESWRARYDRALDHLQGHGGQLTALRHADGEEAYRAANRHILQSAAALATGNQRAVALVIASEGEGEMVEDFTARAALLGIPVLRIDPAVDLSCRPHCFVAMPFGRKLDPQRNITIDCDELYQRVLIPALENAQLRYRRADEQIDAGVVLQPMIEAISDAHLVIADLASANFNVGWELGLRHLLRPRHTLLMLPAKTKPPFDLAMLRHVSYEQKETGISEAAAIAAWQALEPFLEAVADPRASGSDSPVDAVMQVEQWASLRPHHTRDERFEALREQLSLARDLRDGQLMLQVLDDAQGINQEQRALLAGEAGVGLVRLGQYSEGRELLAPLVQTDPEVRRPAAHVFYAQSIYKPLAAAIADYDAAEVVLKHILVKLPEHPEVWAGLGAIGKRRSKLRDTPEEAAADIRKAMAAYQHDYERDLNRYYEGINVLACGVMLARGLGHQEATAPALRVLPAVELAARLAFERDPRDFWSAVTLAEAELCGALLGAEVPEQTVRDAYERAGRCKPPPGELDSSVTQLRLMLSQGVPRELLDIAAAGLSAGAGEPVALGEN